MIDNKLLNILVAKVFIHFCISQGFLEEQNLQNESLYREGSLDWLKGCGPANPTMLP